MQWRPLGELGRGLVCLQRYQRHFLSDGWVARYGPQSLLSAMTHGRLVSEYLEGNSGTARINTIRDFGEAPGWKRRQWHGRQRQPSYIKVVGSKQVMNGR